MSLGIYISINFNYNLSIFFFFLIFNKFKISNFSRYVYGSDLFICGNQIYNHFYDCKEVNSYLCNDKINDVIGNHKVDIKLLNSYNIKNFILFVI